VKFLARAHDNGVFLIEAYNFIWQVSARFATILMFFYGSCSCTFFTDSTPCTFVKEYVPFHPTLLVCVPQVYSLNHNKLTGRN
jgi:long-subunit acyl-CoA synthetase (AMP-forming)